MALKTAKAAGNATREKRRSRWGEHFLTHRTHRKGPDSPPAVAPSGLTFPEIGGSSGSASGPVLGSERWARKLTPHDTIRDRPTNTRQPETVRTVVRIPTAYKYCWRSCK